MKIAVSGERLGRALPSTLNISFNYFRPVSVKLNTSLLTYFKAQLCSFNNSKNFVLCQKVLFPIFTHLLENIFLQLAIGLMCINYCELLYTLPVLILLNLV